MRHYGGRITRQHKDGQTDGRTDRRTTTHPTAQYAISMKTVSNRDRPHYKYYTLKGEITPVTSANELSCRRGTARRFCVILRFAVRVELPLGCIHGESKKQYTELLLIIPQMLTDFQNSFAGRLNGKLLHLFRNSLGKTYTGF